MPDEYLDVVNAQNEVIGQEPRRVVHRDGSWHRGVHVFLFTPDRRLLIQQRSQATDTFPGAWDCSMSEHLRVDEVYQDAVLRGLGEELGIEAPMPLKRLVLFRMDYGPTDNMICELYEAECGEIALEIDPHEIAQIAYHTVPDIAAMMTSGEATFTRWFDHMLRWYTGQPNDLYILWPKTQ